MKLEENYEKNIYPPPQSPPLVSFFHEIKKKSMKTGNKYIKIS